MRKMVEGLEAGKPDYDSMSSGLATAMRQQVPQIQSSMEKLGALQTLVFKAVGPAGPDIYSVRFEKGALEYRIWLGVDGKILSANAHPEEGGGGAVPATSLTPHFPEIDSLVAAELARRPVGSVTAGIVSGKQLVWSKSYGESDGRRRRQRIQTRCTASVPSPKCLRRSCWNNWRRRRRCISRSSGEIFPANQAGAGPLSRRPPITPIQLASHTSGLGREPDDTATYVTGSVANWEKTLIAALPHTHYILEPGTRYSYSNIGFAVLGAALARAAGEPYAHYVPQHIFQPLGMMHSALEESAAILPHLAKGYALIGLNGRVDSETPRRENETGRGYKVPNGDLYHRGRPVPFRRVSDGPRSGECAEDRLLMNRKTGVGVIVLSNGAANPVAVAQRTLDILSK